MSAAAINSVARVTRVGDVVLASQADSPLAARLQAIYARAMAQPNIAEKFRNVEHVHVKVFKNVMVLSGNGVKDEQVRLEGGERGRAAFAIRYFNKTVGQRCGTKSSSELSSVFTKAQEIKSKGFDLFTSAASAARAVARTIDGIGKTVKGLPDDQAFLGAHSAPGLVAVSGVAGAVGLLTSPLSFADSVLKLDTALETRDRRALAIAVPNVARSVVGTATSALSLQGAVANWVPALTLGKLALGGLVAIDAASLLFGLSYALSIGLNSYALYEVDTILGHLDAELNPRKQTTPDETEADRLYDALRYLTEHTYVTKDERDAIERKYPNDSKRVQEEIQRKQDRKQAQLARAGVNVDKVAKEAPALMSDLAGQPSETHMESARAFLDDVRKAAFTTKLKHKILLAVAIFGLVVTIISLFVGVPPLALILLGTVILLTSIVLNFPKIERFGMKESVMGYIANHVWDKHPNYSIVKTMKAFNSYKKSLSMS